MRNKHYIFLFFLSISSLCKSMIADQAQTIQPLLGAWNIGQNTTFYIIQDPFGKEYLGNNSTRFIYKKRNGYYLNEIFIQETTGVFPDIRIKCILPLDSKGTYNIPFTCIAHFINPDSLWFEILMIDIEEKEYLMISTSIPNGRKKIYHRAKEISLTNK